MLMYSITGHVLRRDSCLGFQLFYNILLLHLSKLSSCADTGAPTGLLRDASVTTNEIFPKKYPHAYRGSSTVALSTKYCSDDFCICEISMALPGVIIILLSIVVVNRKDYVFGFFGNLVMYFARLAYCCFVNRKLV